MKQTSSKPVREEIRADLKELRKKILLLKSPYAGIDNYNSGYNDGINDSVKFIKDYRKSLKDSNL